MVKVSYQSRPSDRTQAALHVLPVSAQGRDKNLTLPINAHSVYRNAGPQSDSNGSSTHRGDIEDAAASARRNTSATTQQSITNASSPTPLQEDQGSTSAPIEAEQHRKQPNIIVRFYKQCQKILFSSWINVLLVFVPVGIAVQVGGANKNIIFAMNAIAIVPLAGLLSHATESVASEMGDTIGSLMNVTFGNAVELIIFMYVTIIAPDFDMVTSRFSDAFLIALTKNEIRIVQASLLGSILANLLLILGMCFLIGGLRYREQIYNSTVTQMSACLLSLSVMSLLLPTAFHASFTDSATADRAVLKVSRGTSVILLLIYVLYLLFQLKSHAYMYQSTPQHVIDEESHPGLLHDMLNSSSSSDGSSSSSDSNTDDSSGSVTTAKRIKRVLRGRRRRKSSASSTVPSTLRTPSANTAMHPTDGLDTAIADTHGRNTTTLGAIASGDEADTDGENEHVSSRTRDATINFRDFENEKTSQCSKSVDMAKKRARKKHRKGDKHHESKTEMSEKPGLAEISNKQSPHPTTGFVQDIPPRPEVSQKRPFNLRGLSVRGVVPAAMPAVQNMIASTVFSTANPTGLRPHDTVNIALPRSLHRSSSLPSRLNQSHAGPQADPPLQPQPYAFPVSVAHAAEVKDAQSPQKLMSRTSAIILLLVSTGLVAVCAEFLVASINYLVENSNVSEAFIGLIILPIIGNAAEHVTAVTVASKNKMDLAIGVAVGSSIQIALFVTPVIVLLGWILSKDMSLYFSLFETISLFVSAFIVNFLVLDGRSNYLEGALLIAAYVIIALAAFFYPDSDAQSSIGGASSDARMMLKRTMVDFIDAATAKIL